MDFPPILVLIIIWLFIGLPLSKLNKAAKQQQASKAAQSRGAKQSGVKETQKASVSTAPVAPEPARPTVMQSTITVTEHDDSIYQGSMNAITGEGYDPCHDEQLAPLTLAEAAVPAAAEASPGLQLSWTGNEVVRGFVMSEILKRK